MVDLSDAEKDRITKTAVNRIEMLLKMRGKTLLNLPADDVSLLVEAFQEGAKFAIDEMRKVTA